MSTRRTSLKYRVKGLSATGHQIALDLVELGTETEHIDPGEQILINIENNEEIPDEAKIVLKSYLESMLRSLRPYMTQASSIANGANASAIHIQIPKRLWEQMDRPNVGDLIALELRKESVDDAPSP